MSRFRSGSPSRPQSNRRSSCSVGPLCPPTSTASIWGPTRSTATVAPATRRIADATALVDHLAWPTDTRLILRKEHTHPGAQLRFTDLDGHRTPLSPAVTPTGMVPGQLAELDLRHRQPARVGDRIRQAKDAGLPNVPCYHAAANAGWLETSWPQPIPSPRRNCSASPNIGSWRAARSSGCATRYCRSPPGSPEAPARSNSPRHDQALGPGDHRRRRLDHDPRRVDLTQNNLTLTRPSEIPARQ